MAISQFFLKSISILNEMNYNLKCSERELEFVHKGVYFTKYQEKYNLSFGPINCLEEGFGKEHMSNICLFCSS